MKHWNLHGVDFTKSLNELLLQAPNQSQFASIAAELFMSWKLGN